MKSKLWFTVVCVFLACGGAYGEALIGEAVFPDATFREYVRTFDADSDGTLSDSELASATAIDVSDLGIASLRGIEHFTALRELSCDQNSLTELNLSLNTQLLVLVCTSNDLSSLNISGCSALRELRCGYNTSLDLDVSGNTALEDLRCSYASLGELDLSHNPALKTLACNSCDLSSLNLSGNPALEALTCEENNLSRLDVSGCPVLNILYCDNNNLAALDVSHNPALEYLRCDDNELAALDVTHNPALVALLCDGNKITALDLSANPALESLFCSENLLSALDVSHNSALTQLYCRENNLSSLTIGNLPNLEMLTCTNNNIASLNVAGCPKLYLLLCGNNRLSALDVTHNPALITLHCNRNSLSALDLSANPALTTLMCNNNDLAALDVSHNFALLTLACDSNDLTSINTSQNLLLQILSCSDNRISALDVSGNLMLESLKCGDNPISSFNVSSNTLLGELICNSCDLSVIDVSSNPQLWKLECSYNRISTLDVSRNSLLRRLSCNNNNLTTLNLTSNPALEMISCTENAISTLNISNCPNLEELWCVYNDLAAIDVSHNAKLQLLNARGNKLTAIDVSHNPELYRFWCSENDLTAVDVSHNPALYSFSCYKNKLTALDLSGNPELISLYCYDNRIAELDTSANPELIILSCANNQLTDLDLTHNPVLFTLDCSGNYLTGLDLSQNNILNHLYCRVSYIKELDLSQNYFLEALNCSSTDIKALDLSHNSDLQVLSCDDLMLSSILSIDSSGREDYPYKINLREYLGGNYKLSSFGAYDKNLGPIDWTTDDEFNGTVYFASSPIYAAYHYPTGYTGEAEIRKEIFVVLHVPTRSWIYLPRVEPEVKDPSDDVRATGENSVVEIEQGKVYQREGSEFAPIAVAPGYEPQVESSSGSSSGCDSGFGVVALLALPFVRKRRLLAVLLVLAVASCAMADVRASDYVLPISIERYTPAGTYSLDTELTASVRQKVASAWGISTDRVHPYSQVTSSRSWNFTAQDIAYLADNGLYGGVMLPVTQNTISSDVYVLLCTFSSDVRPGELLSVAPVQVDSEGNSYSDNTKTYFTRSRMFDENMNEIDAVPQNRRVYLSVNMDTNAGVLVVVRGRYVEEEDPLLRLDDDVAQKIADQLGIASSDLKYLSRANFGLPVEPTESMRSYVRSDDHEIVANLPTVSVDTEGIYVVPMTLSDDVWETLKDQSVSDYKFYALNDSNLGDGQMQPAFINGLLSTWEIFTLNGEKLDSFGVKEFLMVGFLEAGKPFSLYLARLLIMLLLGGCNSAFTGMTLVVGFMFLTIYLRRNKLIDRRNNDKGSKRT